MIFRAPHHEPHEPCEGDPIRNSQFAIRNSNDPQSAVRNLATEARRARSHFRVFNPQSAIRNPQFCQSAIRNPQSEYGTQELRNGSQLRTPHSALRTGDNPQSAIRNSANSQFAIRNSQFTLILLLCLAAATASLPGQQVAARKVVVLDAGHGGDDNGVKGPGGTFEKDAALLMAGTLRKILKEDAGLDVALTREDDRRVSLEDRSVIANRSKPALFIGLHGAYSHNPAASGFLVYYYQPTPDQAERYHILKRDVGGREVQLVPWDLAQFRWSEASKALAGVLQLKLNVFYQQFSGAPVALPLEQLSTVNCPAVILEFAYLTNPDQIRKVQDPAWREGCARAVREAVKEFLNTGQFILGGD